jgi:hypothetical protein
VLVVVNGHDTSFPFTVTAFFCKSRADYANPNQLLGTQFMPGLGRLHDDVKQREQRYVHDHQRERERLAFHDLYKASGDLAANVVVLMVPAQEGHA